LRVGVKHAFSRIGKRTFSVLSGRVWPFVDAVGIFLSEYYSLTVSLSWLEMVYFEDIRYGLLPSQAKTRPSHLLSRGRLACH